MSFTRLYTMLPRESVLASLQRKPVGRISYCEYLVDPGVAAKAADGIDKLRFNQEIPKSRKDFEEKIISKTRCLLRR